MTATARVPGALRRARFVAIVGFALRSCLPLRRWVGVLLPSLGAVLFALLSRTADAPAPRAFAQVAAEGIFSLLVPVAALIIGDAVLGAEVRAGTFHFTWLSPAPFWQIIVGRWMAGSAVALVTIAPACALAALVAGVPEAAAPAFLAAAVGSIAYVALFIAVASVTRRTAVWSLAIVFLVERLLGGALSGIAQVSPIWLSRAVFVGFLDDPPGRLVRDGVPLGADAVVRLVLVTVVSLVVACWRVRHMRLSGASD